MDIDGDGGWDAGLCDLFEVPMGLLPEIGGCTATVGKTDPALFGGAIPIRGMAGDQQAVTHGQPCPAPGQTKGTFGTGAFILLASGPRRPPSENPPTGSGLVRGEVVPSTVVQGEGWWE